MNNEDQLKESVDALIAQLPVYQEQVPDFFGKKDAYLLEWSWAFTESLDNKELSEMVDTAIPVRVAGTIAGTQQFDEMELLGAVLDELPFAVALEGHEKNFAAYFLVPAATETRELVDDIQNACEEAITDIKLKISITDIDQLKLTDIAVTLTETLGQRPHQLDILIADVLAHHGWDMKNFADFKEAERVKFWDQQLASLET
ncbi:MAG: hypothetical protein QM632_00825 [Micrococcaceae bacterium]